MKTILVPTDFSPNSEIALQYAAEVAQKAKASLILMHGCDLYEEKFAKYKSLIKEHNSSVVKEIFGKLNDLKLSVEKNYEVIVTVALYEGEDITGTILQAAVAYKADMIIMGTYGATGVRRTLFGSKAAAVINRSTTPVLTIPPTYKWRQPKNIILAVEDEFEDEAVVKPVFDFAELFNADVSAIIFTEEEAEAFEMITHTQSVDLVRQKFNRIFKKVNTEAMHLVGHDFHKSIQQFILDKEVDVLSMITHKRNFLENIFDSSMTQKMSYYSTIPLLSLHMPVEE